jgi:hypothetical protein
MDKKRRRYQELEEKPEEDFLGYFAGPNLIIAVYVDDLLIIGKTSESNAPRNTRIVSWEHFCRSQER